MQALGKLKRLAGRLLRDRDGNFAMMAGLTLPVVILAAGYGVNVAQISITKSNLLTALDSAVTSTARDLTTGAIVEKDAREVVEAFLIANGLRAFAEEGKLTLDSLVIDRVAGTVSAKASVELDVAFALFGTANRQKISVESAALYSDKQIEVAMMLDVTGSMAPDRRGRNDKIGDLKSAAEKAVELLLQNNRAGRERVRIALVPYADAVNAGPLSHTVFVEADVPANRIRMVEPPRLTDPRPASAGQPHRCATDREGTHQFTDVGPERAMVNLDYLAPSCPSAALMPLTHDKDALKARIDNFEASGFTAGQIGVQWSWYLLSPNWASVMPVASRPHSHNPEEVAKYAILMTDGEFNTAYADVEYTTRPARKDYVHNQSNKSRSYAEKLCTGMKKQGIEIFTIGFQLTEPNARTVMRNCASPDTSVLKRYYEASTGAELEAAFTTIARNIETLALTK